MSMNFRAISRSVQEVELFQVGAAEEDVAASGDDDALDLVVALELIDAEGEPREHLQLQLDFVEHDGREGSVTLDGQAKGLCHGDPPTYSGKKSLTSGRAPLCRCTIRHRPSACFASTIVVRQRRLCGIAPAFR